MRNVLLAVALLAGLAACTHADDASRQTYDSLTRADFNRLAVHENLPLYWTADSDHDRAVDPDEVVTLRYYPTATAWTDGDAFTSDFDRAYDKLTAASKATITDDRLARVAKELDQGTPTLVQSDLTQLSTADKKFVAHMLKVGDLIDVLYDRTTGASALASKVPADPLSQSLFRRNRGPVCMASATADDPKCSAIPGSPKLVADAYPAEIQQADDFCHVLEQRPDAAGLMSPFTVIRGSGSDLRAVPYTEVYSKEMTSIADELDAAADTVRDASEAPLMAYLRAAATSFRSNDWEPADEAWSKMDAANSQWYVRVAPDETLTDPCQHKAAFHFNFARINRASIEWQTKLAPLRQEMENELATLAGAPYRARAVSFDLPDFIDIIVNAGDDRFGLDVVTGESLPNWGAVADENRGRTVVMTNVTTSIDGLSARRSQAKSLLDKASLADFADDPTPNLFSNILHEASHNLGPSFGYAVDGKTSETVFGGSLAGMLEELKAQSGALYYVEFLRNRGVIDDTLAAQTYSDSIVWALGQIPHGASGQDADAYAQLAAIQLGFLMDHGALTWNATAMAANGVDKGAFALHTDKLLPAINELMATVAGIKVRGDRSAAEALVTKYADGPAELLATITDRWGRVPRTSMVYSVAI